MKFTIILAILILMISGCSEESKVGGEIKIEFEKCLNGEPDLNQNNLYLVEFWATWCPPCRTSIPHLNKLKNTFNEKPVTFIGISNEDENTIKKFMAQQKFDYFVCIDSKNTMAEKLSVKGIPSAFLISSKGKILWNGHPMNLNENILNSFIDKK